MYFAWYLCKCIAVCCICIAVCCIAAQHQKWKKMISFFAELILVL